jgi:hypothetical protein
MSKTSSRILVIAAGSGLFAVAFFGVALAKGVPLTEIPPLSLMSKPKPAGESAPSAAFGAVASSAPEASGAPNALGASGVEAHAPAHASPPIPPLTAGVLGAFVMPSPLDAKDLQALEKSLKSGLARVAAAEDAQKKRERDLDDWQHVLEQRAQELVAMRKAMDEPAAGDKPGATKSAASWRSLAPLFEEGDPSDVAVRLAELEPDQAAQVLRGLDADRCAAILNALPKERYKTFLDAWRRAGG